MSAPTDEQIVALIDKVIDGYMTEEGDRRAICQLEAWVPGVTEIAFMGKEQCSAQEALITARRHSRTFLAGPQGAEISLSYREEGSDEK